MGRFFAFGAPAVSRQYSGIWSQTKEGPVTQSSDTWIETALRDDRIVGAR
jgi:hypothetical protein